MNYLPVAGWYFYGGAGQTTANRAARAVSWGLLDIAPEYIPPVMEYFSIPTHPIIPVIPTLARMGNGLIILAMTIDAVTKWISERF